MATAINKLKVNVAYIFIVYYVVTVSLAFLLMGGWTFEDYKSSLLFWEDQEIYYNSAIDIKSHTYLLFGANLYPVHMFRLFGDGVLWPIFVNSIFISLTICLLLRDCKKNGVVYIILCYPVLFCYTIDYNKEMIILLGLSAYALYIKHEKGVGVLGLICIGLAKPVIALPLLPLIVRFIRKNIGWVILILLLFTPLLFSLINSLGGKNDISIWETNFENQIRYNYYIASIIGNLIAIIKTFYDAINPMVEEKNLRWWLLYYFFSINTTVLIVNWRNVFSKSNFWLLYLIVVLSYNIIYHYRYFFPVLLILGYSALNDCEVESKKSLIHLG